MRVRLPLLLSSLLALIILSFDATPVSAQSPEDDVRATIDTLFDGMRAGDSTMVSSVFYKGAQMGRAVDQGLRAGTKATKGFLNAIGTPHDEVWDERIWDVKIHVDQRLASVWMEFAFHLDDTLHHCGVNSMQLYRTDEGWKIAYLVDTDRGMDCEIPDSVKG